MCSSMSRERQIVKFKRTFLGVILGQFMLKNYIFVDLSGLQQTFLMYALSIAIPHLQITSRIFQMLSHSISGYGTT